MVWDAARIIPKSWQDALAFYRHIEERNDDFRPLGQLVEHVASQPYAASLATATSGTALLVARSATAEWLREAIRVDVALNGSIRFVWPEKRLVKAATFECEGANVIGAFETFLRREAWIPR